MDEYYISSGVYTVIIILYPPKNKPPPLFSAVDMAQTGEGLIFEYAQCTSNITQIALLTSVFLHI